MRTLLCAAGLVLAAGSIVRAGEAGAGVVVVYNKNLGDSKKLAEYYAAKRGVPAKQLFGVDVNARSEEMSRPEFRDKIQEPLFNWLVRQKLFTPGVALKGSTNRPPALADARIRYLVLC